MIAKWESTVTVALHTYHDTMCKNLHNPSTQSTKKIPHW